MTGTKKEPQRGDGHRTSEGGSFVIDKVIRGVGRMHMASGIFREAQWTLFKAALEEMARDEQWKDALRAVRDRRATPLELWTAYKKSAPTSLNSGVLVKQLLVAALTKWNEDFKREVADDTYKGRKELIREAKRHGKPTTTVQDLPDVIRQMRTKMNSSVQFNQLRNYTRAFVRDTLGKRHPIYAEVVDITPRKIMKRKSDESVTDGDGGRPLSPHEVLALSDAFNRFWGAKKGSRSGDLIAMVLTGRNPKEYFKSAATVHPKGTAKVQAPHVHIDGTKRGGRKRNIPMVFPNPLWPHDTLETPTITQRSFGLALRVAAGITGIECTSYDARRTFGNWMESAGVLRTRRKMYLGHEAGDVTELYERHDVERFLVEDGKKLKAWIIAELRTSPDKSPSGAKKGRSSTGSRAVSRPSSHS